MRLNKITGKHARNGRNETCGTADSVRGHKKKDQALAGPAGPPTTALMCLGVRFRTWSTGELGSPDTIHWFPPLILLPHTGIGKD